VDTRAVPVLRREVLVFTFDSLSGRLEGHVVGARERAAGGGGIKVAEVLVLLRDASTAELSVLRLRHGGAAAVGTAIDFRTDAQRRRAMTARALADESADPALAPLADALAPGSGVVAVAVEHAWLDTLLDGVDRAGGRLSAAAPTGPGDDVDLAARALAAIRTGAALSAS
jgi:hypothetical protein